MRVRERKYPARMSEPDNAPCGSKKRRKETSFWQKKKEVAAALITSSVRKRRIGNSLFLVLVTGSAATVEFSSRNVLSVHLCLRLSTDVGLLCRDFHYLFVPRFSFAGPVAARCCGDVCCW